VLSEGAGSAGWCRYFDPKNEDGSNHVVDVCDLVDFVRPDGPNLSGRQVMTPEGLRRGYLLQHPPDATRQEIEAGYMEGVHEEASFVMAPNMRTAGGAVMDGLRGNSGSAMTGTPLTLERCFRLRAAK